MKSLLPLFFCLPAAAPAQSSDSVTVLSEVEVVENRLRFPFREASRNLHVLTQRDLLNTPGQSVQDALRFVPGVDVRQRGPLGTQADIGIRGGTFDQTLVLLNGVKLSDPQTGHHALNVPVPLDLVERVQVLKGPGARRFGQNAFAGAVNFITRVPEHAGTWGRLYAGQHNTLGATAAVSAPVGDYHQVVAFGYDATEGYRPNSDHENYTAFYQSTFEAAGGRWGFLGAYTDRQFGANGYYSPRFPQQWERIRAAVSTLDYTWERGRWWVQPRVYWRNHRDQFRLRRDDPDFFENNHATNVLGGELNARYTSALGSTGLGAETRREQISSNNLGDRARQQAGLYAEHLFRLGPFDATPGVYLNYFSDWGAQLFPGVDVGAQLLPGLRAYGNVGRAYRIPTYTDLYYSDRTNGSNPDLQPEQSLSWEGGLRYLRGAWHLEANYFQRRATDVIDRVRVSEDDQWVPRNFQEVLTQGWEGSATWRPTGGRVGRWVQQATVSYLYLDADTRNVEELQSQLVIDLLRHQLIGQLDHRVWGPLTHQLRYRFTERVSQPSYQLIDSRLTLDLERVALFGEVTNLLNEEYTEAGWVPMPGRWWRLGWRWRIE
ncbi:MAG: TonB-dependent receptor [Catalinimonas sp.]